jgi:hydrogenase maturation factor
MLGEVAPERLVRSSGAQPGDAIVLTKGIPIEATAIIAREKEAELEETFSSEFVERCKDFLHRPGLSVLRDAQIATGQAPIHAMHDPTEGGLATGLWELAEASSLGLRVYGESVPIPSESALLCAHFGLDPWGAIASGALLLTLAEHHAERVVEALRGKGIEASVVGRMLRSEEGRWLVVEGTEVPLPTFPQDEITKLFEE